MLAEPSRLDNGENVGGEIRRGSHTQITSVSATKDKIKFLVLLHLNEKEINSLCPDHKQDEINRKWVAKKYGLCKRDK